MVKKSICACSCGSCLVELELHYFWELQIIWAQRAELIEGSGRTQARPLDLLLEVVLTAMTMECRVPWQGGVSLRSV